MSDSGASRSSARLLVIGASLVILVAGMKAAASIIVPMLCAAFVAVLSLPLMHWLGKRGVPRWMRLVCVLVGLVVVASAVLLFLGSSLSEFEGELQGYRAGLRERFDELRQWLAEHGVDMGDALSGATDPGFVLGFLGQAAREFGSLMSNSFVIFLWLAFILVEASGLEARLAQLSKDPERTAASIQEVLDAITDYFSIKFYVSVLTGLSAGVLTWSLGVDFPVLWGFVAFLLNFVPNIGSFLAVIPPLLLALVQPEVGLGGVLVLVLGYTGINVLFGSVLEPRWMGRGLDLSTIVVFASLVFWGFVLGPMGMLLSVPLTITVKIALEASPKTSGLADLLGADDPEAAG